MARPLRADPPRSLVGWGAFWYCSGLELGRRLIDLKPGLPLVLFTGYGADLSAEGGRASAFDR